MKPDAIGGAAEHALVRAIDPNPAGEPPGRSIARPCRCERLTCGDCREVRGQGLAAIV